MTTQRQRQFSGNCLTTGCLKFFALCAALGILAAIIGHFTGVTA